MVILTGTGLGLTKQQLMMTGKGSDIFARKGIEARRNSDWN
jgi:hypothetical protein